MPKKFLRRYIPHAKHFRERKALRWLGPLLDDPNLFHLNKHSVSTAFFVGIFCAFLPIPGQTIVAALLALLFGCNLPISVLLIWITNPLTIPPIFYLTFELGRWILDSEPVNFQVQLSLDWFQAQGSHILAPLLLGSLVSGLVFGAIGFFCMHGIWRWRVVRDWEKRKKRVSQQKMPQPQEKHSDRD